MPMFDFVCSSCGAKFEELVRDNRLPACPACGHSAVERQMSIPSPLKTGAFPYKIGPVQPLGQGGTPPCAGAASGGCGGCGHAAPQGGFS